MAKTPNPDPTTRQAEAMEDVASQLRQLNAGLKENAKRVKVQVEAGLERQREMLAEREAATAGREKSFEAIGDPNTRLVLTDPPRNPLLAMAERIRELEARLEKVEDK